MDDSYPEHPKVDHVGPLAAWLNVCAWAYCARNLTDGFVPAERVPRLADVPKPTQLVDRLVKAKLWEVVPGGYMVHDYLEYNPSREQVMAERAATARRVADYRARTTGNSAGNGVTPPVTNTVSNGGSTPVSNGVSTAAPLTPRPGSGPTGRSPVPLPVPPQGRGPDEAPPRAAPDQERAEPPSSATPSVSDTVTHGVSNGVTNSVTEEIPPRWTEIKPGIHRGQPGGKGEVSLMRIHDVDEQEYRARCDRCYELIPLSQAAQHEAECEPRPIPGAEPLLAAKGYRPRKLNSILGSPNTVSDSDRIAAEAALEEMQRAKAERGTVILPPDLEALDADFRRRDAEARMPPPQPASDST